MIMVTTTIPNGTTTTASTTTPAAAAPTIYYPFLLSQASAIDSNETSETKLKAVIAPSSGLMLSTPPSSFQIIFSFRGGWSEDETKTSKLALCLQCIFVLCIGGTNHVTCQSGAHEGRALFFFFLPEEASQHVHEVVGFCCSKCDFFRSREKTQTKRVSLTLTGRAQ